MALNSSNRWTLVLLILILLIFLPACLPQPGSTPLPSPTSPAETRVSGSTPTASSPPTAVTVNAGDKTFDAAIEFGSGPFNLAEMAAGLTNLSSYKAVLTLSFDGTNAGQPNKWSKTYGMISQKNPAARQLTIVKTGALADLTPVYMAEMNGAAYEVRGETGCVANVKEEGRALAARMEPAGFLTAVHGADEAGSETVNAVAAKHYTFDDRALGQMKRAKSRGELWVAVSGGYIVRYRVTTTADAVYFGEGIAGVLTWDYELSDVNQPVTIQLPEDCPDGMVDAPLLPGAANIENLPGSLSYNTSSKPAEAAAFYQKQIPSTGWILDDNQASTDDTTLFLSFTRKDRQMMVTITTDAGVTTVSIQVVR
jgi:hypothetical protein